MERLNAPETSLCLCPLWEWPQSTGVFIVMSIHGRCTPPVCAFALGQKRLCLDRRYCNSRAGEPSNRTAPAYADEARLRMAAALMCPDDIFVTLCHRMNIFVATLAHSASSSYAHKARRPTYLCASKHCRSRQAGSGMNLAPELGQVMCFCNNVAL